MPHSEYVLAFDFGVQRIGVAGGAIHLGIAHPLATITGANTREKLNQIGLLIKEWHPSLLVVGMPSHWDGATHEMEERIRRFAERLVKRFHLPVYFVDERFTSMVAGQRLKEAQVFGKKQKNMLDQVAAMEILESYFTDGAQEELLISE